jgi:hypothetical protein
VPDIIERKGRRGAGSRALAFGFKVFAILLWLGSLLVLGLFGSDFLRIVSLGNPTAMLTALVADDMVCAAVGGLLFGFIIFGVGEIIKLLNRISRTSR